MTSSTLATIQTQLIQYGYPVLIILGTIGTIFIVILFSRHRQNACSIYLINSAIMNNFYLIFNSLFQMIPYYYTDVTTGALVHCKLRSYFGHVLGQMAKTTMILACIDRFLITNDRVHFRALSTPKRAKWLIFFSIIFWLLLGSHIPILITVMNRSCTALSSYSPYFAAYIIIVIALVPPIVLGIFGYLTYRNMKKRYLRVQPAVQNTNDANATLQRRDRDLLIIVISEVLIYVITTIPYSLILSEMNISIYVLPSKSVQHVQIENFIYIISFFIVYVNSAAPFYIYLLTSKSFRQDFKQFIINRYRKLTRQPLV